MDMCVDTDEMYVSARSTTQTRKNYHVLDTSHALKDRIGSKD
jgi:hypothetical protein